MTTKITGSPGSGKTELLTELAKPFNCIAGISFTKAAAKEFSSRVGKSPEHCRTLHSFCFKLLGLKMTDMLDFKLMQQFKEEMGDIGHEVNFYFDEDNYQEQRSLPLYLHQLATNLMQTLDDVYKQGSYDITLEDLKYVCKCYEDFKTRHKIMDFNDILVHAFWKDLRAPSEIEAVFLDEAQDLNVLQWAVFNSLFRDVPNKFIVGDDCQCLYHWSGVDISRFINYPCDKEIILDKSYRLPANILKETDKIFKKIKVKIPREIKPIREGGTVSEISRLDIFEFKTNESYFLLCRNRYLCKQYSKVLIEIGVPFRIEGKPSVDIKDVRAIFAWEKLRKGGIKTSRNPFDFRNYVKDFNLDEPWFEAFTYLDVDKALYYREILRNGFSLDPNKIQVEITTIHKSKGREADNVLLSLDVSSKVYENIESDSEHKVFYVGATRAKKALYYIEAETDRSYEV